MNEGNLNIKSYVKSIDSHESLTLEDSLDKYIEHQNILSDTLSELCFVDSEMPKLSSPNLMYKESNNWARVRLSDVAEEYSVRIDNPSLSEYDFILDLIVLDNMIFEFTKGVMQVPLPPLKNCSKKGIIC